MSYYNYYKFSKGLRLSDTIFKKLQLNIITPCVKRETRAERIKFQELGNRA